MQVYRQPRPQAISRRRLGNERNSSHTKMSKKVQDRRETWLKFACLYVLCFALFVCFARLPFYVRHPIFSRWADFLDNSRIRTHRRLAACLLHFISSFGRHSGNNNFLFLFFWVTVASFYIQWVGQGKKNVSLSDYKALVDLKYANVDLVRTLSAFIQTQTSLSSRR